MKLTRTALILGCCTALPISLGTASYASAATNGSGRSVVATPAVRSATHLPVASASQPVRLAIQLKLRNAAQAEQLATAVSTPGNKHYGHFLTPTEFNKRFAPTAKTVAAVKKFATNGGLRVVSVPSNNRYVEVAGPASAVNKLFKVTVRRNPKQSAAPLVADRQLTAPNQIATSILTVTGLDGVRAQTGARSNDTKSSSRPDTVSRGPLTRALTPSTRNTIATPCSSFWGQHTATLPQAYGKDGFPTAICGYNPDQLQAAYGVQPMIVGGQDGRGQKVAIIDAYNLPSMESDANTYFQAQGERGFAPGQYTTVEPAGYTNQSDCGESSWNGEQALDVESVHGIAPGAKITYVAAKSCLYQDMIDPLNTIVNKHLANIVSNSWGFFGESTIPTSTLQATHAVLVQAAAEGIGMYFCTLDNGDETAMYGVAQAVYPASDPFVTAVGGTTLGVAADGSRDLEVGWGSARAGVSYDANGTPTGYNQALPGQFYSGGGGGPSAIFAQPKYQKGVVPAAISEQYGDSPMRVEPDIAAVADPYTGYEIGYTVGGQMSYMSYGGTSLATPVVASLAALASQGRSKPIGFANPLLYQATTRKTLLDIKPTRVPVAMAFTSNLSTSGCYQTCLITADRDTSLRTGSGFDTVTGLGAPKGAAFIKALAGKR